MRQAQGVRFATARRDTTSMRADGQVIGVALEDGGKLQADAYVVALGSYSPLLLAPLGIRIPVYPLKGYSITLPLGPEEAAAAPTVSLTDEAHKIVISRLGNRLRAAGTAELTGYDTQHQPGALRRDRRAHPAAVPGAERRHRDRLLGRPAPGHAEQRAGHRPHAAAKPLPQYRARHARLDARLRLRQRARRSRLRAASREVDFRFHEELANRSFSRSAACATTCATGAAAGAPKMVLLHGWMDVSASFQFLVDALQRDWDVYAPDWRGYGLTDWGKADCYWFPDYLADLDSLLDGSSRKRRSTWSATASAATLLRSTPACGPSASRKLVNLEGFGMAPTRPEQAPKRYARWLEELHDPPGLRPYANFAELAERLRAGQHAADARAGAISSRGTGASEVAGKGVVLRGDPAHKIVNPVLYRFEEARACWQRDRARRCCGSKARNPKRSQRMRLEREPARRAPARPSATCARARAAMRATCCITTSRKRWRG